MTSSSKVLKNMLKRNNMRIFLSVLIMLGLCFPLRSRERKSRTVQVRATAYCPCAICCGKHADGKTAIGRDATTKGVAVDPRKIKLRSYLDIPGYANWVMADDTGRAIKGNRIDIRFRTHEEAVKFGVKTITVRIWD